MKIGLTNTNKLTVNGHYLCGLTQSDDQVIEQFDVTLVDVLARLQTVVKPVRRADIRQRGRGFVDLDENFKAKLNESLMRLLAEELTQ